MALKFGALHVNLSPVLKDVAGKGGLLDNLSSDLNSGNDPTGISASIADQTTLLGNLFGTSGVVADLLGGGTRNVVNDLVGPGSLVENLVNDDDPLGTNYLLNGGNVAGNGGVTDDALNAVFFG
ncbi:hypothetical protein [Sphingomonas sp. ID0503]|uniref:hypothetical protein n=1 Tax=Sphingomonas sp. ID0503 TaxID=3399691 RepID=UPI003AFA8DBF